MVQVKEYLGKHYTNTEKTGLSVNDEKLLKLLTAFKQHIQSSPKDEEDNSNRVKSDRLTIKRLISGALKIKDYQTINGWFDLCIGSNFLDLNPTSEFQQVKDGPRTRYCNTNYKWEYDQKYKIVHKPTSDSKYFFNGHVIDLKINELMKAQNGNSPHTLHSSQKTLTDTTTISSQKNCEED